MYIIHGGNFFRHVLNITYKKKSFDFQESYDFLFFLTPIDSNTHEKKVSFGNHHEVTEHSQLKKI